MTCEFEINHKVKVFSFHTGVGGGAGDVIVPIAEDVVTDDVVLWNIPL